MKDNVIVINIARNDEYIIIPDEPITFNSDGGKIFNEKYKIEFEEQKIDDNLYIQIVDILINMYKENDLYDCKVYKRVL